MSLDKSIKSGKEHRKPYRGAKEVSDSCRNHGSCDYCKGNRTYNTNKKLCNSKKNKRPQCMECANFTSVGEDGVHICIADNEPRVITEEYTPTDDYFWCNGTLYESWDEYE